MHPNRNALDSQTLLQDSTVVEKPVDVYNLEVARLFLFRGTIVQARSSGSPQDETPYKQENPTASRPIEQGHKRSETLICVSFGHQIPRWTINSDKELDMHEFDTWPQVTRFEIGILDRNRSNTSNSRRTVAMTICLQDKVGGGDERGVRFVLQIVVDRLGRQLVCGRFVCCFSLISGELYQIQVPKVCRYMRHRPCNLVRALRDCI